MNKRVPVLDRDRFQNVLRSFVLRYPHRSAAADALGITGTHLGRLLSEGPGESVSRSLVEKLMMFVVAEERVELDKAILSERGMELYDDWHRWLTKCLRPYRYQVPRGAAKVVSLRGLRETSSRPPTKDAGTLAEPVERLYEKLGTLRPKRRAKPYAAKIWEMVKRLETAGHSDLRILLAIVRILEPLMAGQLTNHIELDVSELHKRKMLGPYLDSAITAQESLLTVFPAYHRAQDIAQRG